MSCINVIVGCTARKRAAAGDTIRFRELQRGLNVAQRAQRWCALIDDAKTVVLPPDLYCGDGWSTVWNSLGVGENTINLNIVSAGYGLVRSDELISPYSITFARRDPDSILEEGEATSELRKWWLQLSRWRCSQGRRPASIREIASSFPENPLVVALSPVYLAAVTDDLLAARRELSDPHYLVIISAGAKKTGPLVSNFLPCDARLEHCFGGARSSLNARIARYILANVPAKKIRSSLLQSVFEALLNEQPDARSFSRKKVSDEQVIAFIEASGRRAPKQSCSTLLRALRQSGRACEQARFRQLFTVAKRGV